MIFDFEFFSKEVFALFSLFLCNFSRVFSVVLSCIEHLMSSRSSSLFFSFLKIFQSKSFSAHFNFRLECFSDY